MPVINSADFKVTPCVLTMGERGEKHIIFNDFLILRPLCSAFCVLAYRDESAEGSLKLT